MGVVKVKNKRNTFIAPSCIYPKMNCFAERHGKCMGLTNTNFKNGKCPFYKHIDVFKEELIKYPRTQNGRDLEGKKI